MLERLMKLLEERATAAAAAQPQREAMIDLLVWMMYADRHVAISEIERIEAEAKRMDWSATRPVESFISQSKLRARRVVDGERSAEDYLTEIGNRLGDGEARKRALEACEELAAVDGKIPEEEVALLKTIALHFRFGLDS